MKRIFDVITSLILLAIISPVFIIVHLMIYINLGAPVIFRQKRPGKDCKPFYLLKFRTMTNERDRHGELLPNEQRHTRLGIFLRSFSLDELPSLINVLKGEMSMVGPRPLKMDYLNLYNNEQIRRHEVRPGITGWAQVNGRNALSYIDRFKLDVWYVDHHNLFLDIKIIWRTINKVYKKEGILPEGKTDMIPFDGTN